MAPCCRGAAGASGLRNSGSASRGTASGEEDLVPLVLPALWLELLGGAGSRICFETPLACAWMGLPTGERRRPVRATGDRCDVTGELALAPLELRLTLGEL